MRKIQLFLQTLAYLKRIQIYYQLWYRIRQFLRKLTGFSYPLLIKKQGNSLKLTPWIDKPTTLQSSSASGTDSIKILNTAEVIYTFTFLNISRSYSITDNSINRFIDWNDSRYGKLWSYNLNYMDYLLQRDLKYTTGLFLIEQFIITLPTNPTALEPYPISIRTINWIKFLSKPTRAKSKHRLSFDISKIDSSLFAQYQILIDNIEYHILGNHLLENGFSLLFGAFYFRSDKFYNKASEILNSELHEQILDDGGHFESSPMYHQIILDRILDCINLIQMNKQFKDQELLLDLLQKKARKMLGWLDALTFSNNKIPLLNDSTTGIAPTTKQLQEYASSLKNPIVSDNLLLSASGYRRFNRHGYECIIDIGEIGPSYQPGHSHADTFSFVLNICNNPFIVDIGISTYDSNTKRLFERGTAAHNTVTISDENSSQVWSSFRVGKRAKVDISNEEIDNIVAKHNGYRKLRTTHQREWKFYSEMLEIEDSITGRFTTGKAHFWFSPEMEPLIIDNKVVFKQAELKFTNPQAINIIKTKIPSGYNCFIESYKIEVNFEDNLTTAITIK